MVKIRSNKRKKNTIKNVKTIIYIYIYREREREIQVSEVTTGVIL